MMRTFWLLVACVLLALFAACSDDSPEKIPQFDLAVTDGGAGERGTSDADAGGAADAVVPAETSVAPRDAGAPDRKKGNGA